MAADARVGGQGGEQQINPSPALRSYMIVTGTILDVMDLEIFTFWMLFLQDLAI